MISTRSSGLRSGLFSGWVAALGANLVLLVHRALGGSSHPEINVWTVTLAALLACLAAALVYAWLAARRPNAKALFRGLGGGLAFLSLMPGLVQPLHPGMNTVTVPLHLVVALTALVLIPRRAP